jgi:hypothetical protein
MYTRALSGDLEVATRLMNNLTFNNEGIKTLEMLRMNGLVKTYEAWMPLDDEPFQMAYTLYAPNDDMALYIWDAMMTVRPLELREVITTYREVQL